VVYQFDGTKLERKATVGGKHDNAVTACETSENAFQFLVTVEPGKIVVNSPKCEKPDIYTADDRDLTKGKIGIKRDIEFVIR
jgi:hypothetical protein